MEFTFNFQADRSSPIGQIIMQQPFRISYTGLYKIDPNGSLRILLFHRGRPIAEWVQEVPPSCTIDEANRAATKAILSFVSSAPDVHEDFLYAIIPYLTNADAPVPDDGSDPPSQNIYVLQKYPYDILHIGKHKRFYDVGSGLHINDIAYKVARVKSIYGSSGEEICRICLIVEAKKKRSFEQELTT